jgi:hypothetical protein
MSLQVQTNVWFGDLERCKFDDQPGTGACQHPLPRHRPKKYAKLAWFLRKVGGWRGHTDMDSSGWWQPEFFEYISFVFGQHFTHT